MNKRDKKRIRSVTCDQKFSIKTLKKGDKERVRSAIDEHIYFDKVLCKIITKYLEVHNDE